MRNKRKTCFISGEILTPQCYWISQGCVRISPSHFRISTPTPAFLTEVLCGLCSPSNKISRLATTGFCLILPKSIIHKHVDSSQYTVPFKVNLSVTNIIALYFSRKFTSQDNVCMVHSHTSRTSVCTAVMSLWVPYTSCENAHLMFPLRSADSFVTRIVICL